MLQWLVDSSSIEQPQCLVDGNTPSIVLVSGGETILPGTTGGAVTVTSWAMGRRYTDSADDTGTSTAGNLDPPPNKPATLLSSSGQWFTRSKPQYETLSAGSFVSVASFGAVGRPDRLDLGSQQGLQLGQRCRCLHPRGRLHGLVHHRHARRHARRGRVVAADHGLW